MRLAEVSAEGFRNLETTRIALAPATTVLLGDNGQGKTSFLEAIGVLATTRSFRKARAPDLVRHGAEGFVLSGELHRSGHEVRLGVAHREGRRELALGRASVDLAEYIGHLEVIAITQAHAGIVRGSPQERRDFLDRGILGLSPSYLRTLSAWRRGLRQKAALLRSAQEGASLRAQLGAWNERLLRDAAEMTWRRRLYAAELSRVLEGVGPVFLPEAEQLSLSLRDVVARDEASAAEPSRERVEQLLRERFEEQAPREVASAQALVGPHRDELLIELGGRDVRRYASSGQQRNALLALKVAKVELFRRERGESPVLLVDDVDTEIDPTRLDVFLREVGGRAQAVLTSSKRDLFGSPPSDSRFYSVRAGAIAPA